MEDTSITRACHCLPDSTYCVWPSCCLFLHVWITFTQFLVIFIEDLPMYPALFQRSWDAFCWRHLTIQAAGSVHRADFDQLKCKLYRNELKGSGEVLFTSLSNWIMCFPCAILTNHHAFNPNIGIVFSDSHGDIFTLADFYLILNDFEIFPWSIGSFLEV